MSYRLSIYYLFKDLNVKVRLWGCGKGELERGKAGKSRGSASAIFVRGTSARLVQSSVVIHVIMVMGLAFGPGERVLLAVRVACYGLQACHYSVEPKREVRFQGSVGKTRNKPVLFSAGYLLYTVPHISIS